MATLKHVHHIEKFRIGYLFPWLKNHGHIEAHFPTIIPPRLPQISMIEKSWPHWSIFVVNTSSTTDTNFHDWKIMATLKRKLGRGICSHIYNFHDWKIMATLKQEFLHSLSEFLQTYFHDWKIMATLKHLPLWIYDRYFSPISMIEKSWPHWSMK